MTDAKRILEFSVIVPVYNKERHVAASIASALAQSHAPTELILIDDASTDGSRAILDDLASQHPGLIRLLVRDTPGPGGYAARNLGIEQARCDWIAFLDADDLWHSHHLADLAEAAAAHPATGCLSTRYDHVHADRRYAAPLSAALEAAAGRELDLATFLSVWLAQGDCPIWTSAAAFSRETLLRAGLFPEGRARRGGDKDLWLRAVAQSPFVYVPRVSAEFHRDSDNKVSKTAGITDLPIIVSTARELAARAAPVERRLLRRLINQQIGLYFRFSFKQARISPKLLDGLCLPEGLGLYLMIVLMRLVPAPVRMRLHGQLRSA